MGGQSGKAGLSFAGIQNFPQGLLFSLLSKSYSSLLEKPEVKHRKDLLTGWREFDESASRNLETVGQSVFISLSGTSIIGFGSYDPRQWPKVGVIGHNCILPEFRGRGWGRAQLLEIVGRLKEKGFRKARASTGDHPFFLPARKMYLSCGFKETRRLKRDHVDFPEIEYELNLREA